MDRNIVQSYLKQMHCGRVLGLELVPEAVQDAKANAELNGIENCEFFAGRAEDILPSVLARTTGEDIIAIVDPPRAGLHMRAITQLRNTKTVKRLIYISCSPASAVKNFIDLSRQTSKTLRGAPFVPIRAVTVDMFPNTKHVELAILFEREQTVSQEKDAEKSTENGETAAKSAETPHESVENAQVSVEKAQESAEKALESEETIPEAISGTANDDNKMETDVDIGVSDNV